MIDGQSAGGGSVLYHALAADSCDGLFTRAIAESPAPFYWCDFFVHLHLVSILYCHYCCCYYYLFYFTYFFIYLYYLFVFFVFF